MSRTAAALALALAAGTACAQPSFELLGTLPGTSIVSEARGVSDDGSTISGWSGSTFYYGASPHAFRWSHSSGIQDLDPLAPEAAAWAISGDGQTIVGLESSTGSAHAFQWLPSGPLELFHGGEAQAVSHDGSVIGGFEFDGGSHSTVRRAIRWSSDRSRADFIDVPETTSSETLGVSADGGTLVGYATYTALGIRAFRWTQADGMQNIGSTLATGPASRAFGVSSGGSLIVGSSTGPTGSARAIAWTTTGTLDLGALIGGVSSTAYAVSADGSTIVGAYAPAAGGPERAFLWRADAGMQDLQTLLAGVIPPGWSLIEARAVSANGRFIAGSASGPGVSKEAFLATLPPPASSCYANCDQSTTPPILNVNDFVCFQSRFAAGSSDANCDQSTTPPILNVNDFVCFQTRFAAGCP